MPWSVAANHHTYVHKSANKTLEALSVPSYTTGPLITRDHTKGAKSSKVSMTSLCLWPTRPPIWDNQGHVQYWMVLHIHYKQMANKAKATCSTEARLFLNSCMERSNWGTNIDNQGKYCDPWPSIQHAFEKNKVPIKQSVDRTFIEFW